MTSSARLTTVVLAAAAAATACRTKANPESCLVTPCGSGLTCDSMMQLCVGPDGGTGGDGGPPGSIFIAAPMGPMAYANATLTIAVDLAPGSPAPASVDILKDGAKLATVASSPPYTTEWDTTKETEGSHQISARATISGRVVMAPAVTVVVDRQPPMIKSQIPIGGAGNVLLSDPIEIHFSEALDPKTVSGSSIGLSTPAGPLPASVTLSSDGTTVSIVVTDRSSLTFPSSVTESVAATVADLAGNQLGAAGTSSWTAPRWVTLASFSGQAPSVAIGPDDHPIVSYVSSTGVAIAKYAPGAVWDVSIPPPTTGAVTVAAPIAVDMTGTPVVAWSSGHTFVARYTTTTGWDTTAYGNVPDTGTQGSVSDLKLDGMGQPVVGWSTQPCQMCSPSALAARWNQGAWEPLFAGTTPITMGAPLLQLDSTGAPALISNTGNGFKILKYTGGSWLPIDTSGVSGGAQAVADTLALDGQDRPLVVAEVSQGPTIFRVQYLNAGAWANLTTPWPSTSATAPNEVHVVLDGSGNPTLVWSEIANSEQSLHVAKFTGTAWEAMYDPLSGFFGANTNASGASVAIDKAGAPVVVWQESNGTASSPSIFMWRANR